MNPYAKFLEHRDPLTVAAATPAKIVSLIRGLTPRQLAKRPAPGKWSIQEIISHLADTEMVMGCRARWIAFEEHPTLVPFDQEKWAAGWAREKEPLAETLERFRIMRKSQLRLFRRASKADLQRTGFHPERGEVTLQVQLETLAGHDLNHLEQIQRLAAQHKARP
ncbi:MAG TPA: DinB family protein [Candidatus Methylomirabilis sp.]|nr:DinB family protein [Candidatus Methylomirabilis sp.]